MSKKSKWFAIFTEGATVDGRTILREWIEQIAETYDPKKYGARIFCEHIRSYSPNSDFGAYGDVLAVKAEEVDGKLTLFAQIDPTDDLLALNKKRQKVYTSAEIDPDFAGTGKCNLVGLAITDSPASLGTDMLMFNAQQDHPLFGSLNSRKQNARNHFTAATEFTLELEEAGDDGDKQSFFKKIAAMFTKTKAELDGEAKETRDAVEVVANHVSEYSAKVEKLEADNKALAEKNEALQGAVDELQTSFNQLKSDLDKAPGGFRRNPATGGDGAIKTDC